MAGDVAIRLYGGLTVKRRYEEYPVSITADLYPKTLSPHHIL